INRIFWKRIVFELHISYLIHTANKYPTDKELEEILAHLSESEDNFDIEEGDDEESLLTPSTHMENQERRNSMLNMPVEFEDRLVFPNDVNKVENTEDDNNYVQQKKNHKWGYKLYLLCETDEFSCKFEIFMGDENSSKYRQPGEPDLESSG
ncbi:hypothetical protein ILUMI_00034, partial [Ignelater luminosus]